MRMYVFGGGEYVYSCCACAPHGVIQDILRFRVIQDIPAGPHEEEGTGDGERRSEGTTEVSGTPGVGFRVQGLGFRVQGLGFRV